MSKKPRQDERELENLIELIKILKKNPTLNLISFY